MMKISAARVIVSCPGRNFVTLRIVTDDGFDGIGDATLNGRELAVASCLEDHVIPCLIGRDASQIEDIWQYLYRGAYWRRGPVTMSAVSAVDTALWDIKAKAAGMPLYQLLDGRSRNHVRTGCHGATDLSPVCMGAALHFDTWVPNFGVQEYMQHGEETEQVFPHDYYFADGYLHVGETPGHGVTIKEDLAEKFPYQRAYLPVNRLQDGTMWNW
jgi:L-alanine-DL-glutamate epimerase-like enolase superfamily enzyme